MAQIEAGEFRGMDFYVVCAANVINLSMAVLFSARLAGWGLLESSQGVVVAILGLSFGVVSFLNRRNRRGRWEVALPLPFFIFSIVHITLQYILAMEFRDTPLVGPYLLLYYSSLWMLIGYAFRFSKRWGFVTLATYFLNMSLSLVQYAILGR